MSRICLGPANRPVLSFGLVPVAVKAVDPDRIERLQVTLPHPREGRPFEPGVVGDEADHA